MDGTDDRPLLLLVEDQEELSEATALGMVDRGWRVVTAADAREAASLASRRPPDAVLTDLRLPDSDGVAHIRLLRERLPGVPLVVVSGYLDAQVARELSRLGVIEVLSKPARHDDLHAALRRAIGRSVRRDHSPRPVLGDETSRIEEGLASLLSLPDQVQALAHCLSALRLAERPGWRPSPRCRELGAKVGELLDQGGLNATPDLLTELRRGLGRLR